MNPTLPYCYTISLPPKTQWEPVRAQQFIEQLIQTLQIPIFRIVAEPHKLEWQILDLALHDPVLVENAIRTIYPDAQVECGHPQLMRPNDAPTYRFIAKYRHLHPVFLAPLVYATDIRDADPLAAVTQAMSHLLPGERITYTLIVVGFADYAYQEGQRLLARDVFDGTLGGLLFPEREAVYEPQFQRVLEEKLDTRLSECLLFIEFESPSRKRLETLVLVDSQVVLFDRPRLNGIRHYDESFSKNIVHLDESDLDLEHSALGLYLTFMGSDQYKLTRQLRKTSEAMRLILNPQEIASLWHLPHDGFRAPTIQWAYKTVPMPRQLVGKRDGLCLGENWTGRARDLVYLSDPDRATHMTIVGKTGTGKSTLLHHLIYQDILRNKGVAVIDHHGDLVRDILRTSIPPSRDCDVVVIDLANEAHPPPLNLLAVPRGGELMSTAGQVVSLIERLTGSLSDTPRVADTLTMALVTLWQDDHPTLLDVDRLFDDPAYRRRLVQKTNNIAVTRFWDKFELQSNAQQEQLSYPVIYRMRSLYGNDTLLPIMCHPDVLDFSALIEQRKIVLVSLAVDEQKIPPRERDLLGAAIMLAFQNSLSLSNQRRSRFALYIDEAERLVTTSLPELFETARKRGLTITLANQYFRQLAGDTLEAVMGNVGAMIAFQCGMDDARILAPYMQPGFEPQDLVQLDKFQAAVWMRDHGQTLPAFSLMMRPPLLPENRKQATQREYYLRDLSTRLYTPQTREQVIDWINQRYAPTSTEDLQEAQDELYDPKG